MAEERILPAADIKQQFPKLGNFLSKADFDRLTVIMPLFKSQQASKAVLSACLDAISTGRTPQEKMADFRAFWQRLRQAARKAGLGLILEVDSKKRAQPHDRLCWFTQPAAARITESVEAFSQDVVSNQDAIAIPSRAKEVGPRHVQFFVSYDREADYTLGKKLLEQLQYHFRSSLQYQYGTWDQSAIPVGEHRAHAIAEALDKTDFGLLLVSVSWLAKFEPTGDQRIFVTENGKPVIPVVLKDVDEHRHNLHGLEARQLFRFEPSRGVLKSFEKCRTPVERDDFTKSLFVKVEQ